MLILSNGIVFTNIKQVPGIDGIKMMIFWFEKYINMILAQSCYQVEYRLNKLKLQIMNSYSILGSLQFFSSTPFSVFAFGLIIPLLFIP